MRKKGGGGELSMSNVMCRVHQPTLHINPFVPTVAFSQLSSNMCCPRDCVSRHNGGTSGAPIMSRDVVSRTANVERTVNGGDAQMEEMPKWRRCPR